MRPRLVRMYIFYTLHLVLVKDGKGGVCISPFNSKAGCDLLFLSSSGGKEPPDKRNSSLAAKNPELLGNDIVVKSHDVQQIDKRGHLQEAHLVK